MSTGELSGHTNIDDDIDLPSHPVVSAGTLIDQSTDPCSLRPEGTSSLVQTHPKSVRSILDLEPGTIPFPIVHPDINAVTYIYR